MSKHDNFKLRNFRADDFDAFHALVSDYDVVKMLGTWPYPADPEFTRMRMNTPEAQAGMVNVVECDGQLAGTIGLVNGGIGYNFAKPFWGRGLATWAARTKIRQGFLEYGLDKITAGAHQLNPASAAVLMKSGLRKVGEDTAYCKARDRELSGDRFELSRADWAAHQPLLIETERLRIEPFENADATALSELMNDEAITRMMQTIPLPFTPVQAADWIAKRPFEGKVGFVAKISLKDGTLIGFIGLGGDPVNVAYALGRKFWGQGYITEAMLAFLNHVTKTFALDEITAGAFADNPASQRVLGKLGFERTGQKVHKATSRLEEAQLFLYRLRRSQPLGQLL